jgi:hypothetical protein
MNKLVVLGKEFLQIGTFGAVALVSACSTSIDPEKVITSQTLIDQMPSLGAEAIARIDVAGLREALPEEQWKRYEEIFLEEGIFFESDGAELRQMWEGLGTNPRESLEHISFAIMHAEQGAGGDADHTQDEMLILVSGDFDHNRFELALTNAIANWSSEDIDGTTMWWVDEASTGLVPFGQVAATPPIIALAFLDDTTLAIGNQESLYAVIGTNGSRLEPLESGHIMNDLISEVAGQGQIWLVATDSLIPTLLGSDDAPLMLPSVIGNLEAISMSVQMGDGLSARFAGITPSSEDTRMLTESFNGLVAMGKMMLQGSQPELFEIMDGGVHAEQDNQQINIEVSLSQTNLDFLLSIAEQELRNMAIGSGL